MKVPSPYYRESAAAVLASFDSQTSGLTKQQVTQRQHHSEQLLVPPHSYAGTLLPSLKLRISMLLGLATLAFYVSLYSVGILLFLIVLSIGLFAGFYDRRIWRGHAQKNMRLPKVAKVVRGNMLHTIAVKQLVSGDIIFVESGDILPADVRILKAHGLLANESLFSGSSQSIHKNSRAVAEYVARDKQTNMLFLGSSIVAGDGYGVVTALGAHSELGRLLWARKKAVSAPTSKRVLKAQRRTDSGVAVLIAVLGLLTLANGWTIELFTLTAATLLVGSSLLDFYIVVPFVAAHYGHVLGRSSTKVLQLASLEKIGASATLVADISTALMPPESTVRGLTVGSQYYAVSGTSFTKLQKDSLGLLATVCSLIGRLPAGRQFTAIAQELPSTEAARYAYVESPQIPNDTALHSSVWRTEDSRQVMQLVNGELEHMLHQPLTHIWDHGHVRTITQNDRKRLLAVAAKHTAAGIPTTAVAYSHSTIAKELVFMAYIESTFEPPVSNQKIVRSLKRAHVSLILVSDETLHRTEWLLDKSGLAESPLVLITHDDVEQLTPQRIAQLAKETVLVLHNVSAHDIALVTHSLQANGPVTVVGDRLEIAEVLEQADAVIAGSRTFAADYAGVLSAASTLSASYDIISAGRRVLRHSSELVSTTLLLCFSLTTIAWLSVILKILADVPALTTAFSSCLVIAALLPVLISTAWDKETISSIKPQNLSRPAYGKHLLLQIVLVTAAASCAFMGFLLLQHLHPGGLAASGNTYDEAVTVTALTVAICMLAQIFINRSSTRHAGASKAKTNHYFWLGLLVSIGILFAGACSTALQSVLGTSTPLASSWLLIGGIGLLYTALAVVLHYDAHHTRRAITTLQRAHKK